ncbi:thioesterase II family protein [Sellimonas intestinalis]|uniref:thioesterase II family protein n=1 Tax=Sellimonas intestinalis TaxID=1653434 RepID=UPI0015EB5ECF|nr:alpha/beta fold hydrolase [Sellimonas intestinalis]MBA2213295.1 thioesterase [Sellimonas intestinalis]
MSDKIILYTIPFAGGSSFSYSSWNKYLDSDIELVNLDYSGHGKRMDEKLFDNFDDVVNDILQCIVNHHNKSRFMIYGHSMGGMVAYFVSHILQDKFHMNPDCLFIGGCPSPKFFSRNRKKYQYDEIVDQMIRDNRITPEIAESNEFKTQIYPIIENDYNMICRNFDDFFNELLINITICIAGLQDSTVDSSGIRDWNNYISRVEYRSVDDEHYFNENSSLTVCNIINKITCIKVKHLQEEKTVHTYYGF